MSIELKPSGDQRPLAKMNIEDESRKKRAAYKARSSSGLYGSVGWITGLLITFILSAILVYIVVNVDVSRSALAQILAVGIAIIWWFNPLSLGGLGYIASNARIWRFWTI